MNEIFRGSFENGHNKKRINEICTNQGLGVRRPEFAKVSQDEVIVYCLSQPKFLLPLLLF